MSRSRRYNPFVQLAGNGDPWARRAGNRRYRHRVKSDMQRIEPDAEVLPLLRQHSNKDQWPSEDTKVYAPNYPSPRLVKRLRK